MLATIHSSQSLVLVLDLALIFVGKGKGKAVKIQLGTSDTLVRFRQTSSCVFLDHEVLCLTALELVSGIKEVQVACNQDQ